MVNILHCTQEAHINGVNLPPWTLGHALMLGQFLHRTFPKFLKMPGNFNDLIPWTAGSPTSGIAHDVSNLPENPSEKVVSCTLPPQRDFVQWRQETCRPSEFYSAMPNPWSRLQGADPHGQQQRFLCERFKYSTRGAMGLPPPWRHTSQMAMTLKKTAKSQVDLMALLSTVWTSTGAQ